jgi:hypothetical protein
MVVPPPKGTAMNKFIYAFIGFAVIWVLWTLALLYTYFFFQYGNEGVGYAAFITALLCFPFVTPAVFLAGELE